MSHFAKVIDGIVVNVIVAEQDFIDTLLNSEQWIQTSYNTHGGIHYDPYTKDPSSDQSKSLRKNYAGIGYKYNEIKDAFIVESSFESWILNESTCLWESPIPYPNDGKYYSWNEENQSWEEFT